MRALLLAAGMGTRLRPLTLKVPKCLVPVGGKPLLDYWLEHLFAHGVDRVLINTHWLGQAVGNHVANSPFCDRVDLVYEDALLGTGGTVRANREWLGQTAFLVAHADNLTDFDVASFIMAHRQRPAECEMTMLAFHTDHPQSCGILEVDDRNVVRAFHEKVKSPPGNLANAAVYMFEPQIQDRLSAFPKGTIDLSTEVIPLLLGKIYAVPTLGYHRDIGSREALERAEAEWASLQMKQAAPRQSSTGNFPKSRKYKATV